MLRARIASPLQNPKIADQRTAEIMAQISGYIGRTLNAIGGIPVSGYGFEGTDDSGGNGRIHLLQIELPDGSVYRIETYRVNPDDVKRGEPESRSCHTDGCVLPVGHRGTCSAVNGDYLPCVGKLGHLSCTLPAGHPETCHFPEPVVDKEAFLNA